MGIATILREDEKVFFLPIGGEPHGDCDNQRKP